MTEPEQDDLVDFKLLINDVLVIHHKIPKATTREVVERQAALSEVGDGSYA